MSLLFENERRQIFDDDSTVLRNLCNFHES